MRIKLFKAESVHGSFSPKVDFSKNPTILIAPNGAGKTTTLKLIQALLMPNLSFLLEIQFKSAQIDYEDNGKIKKIHAYKSRGGSILNISHSDSKEELTIPAVLVDELGEDLSPFKRRYEVERALRVKYGDHPVYIEILASSKPVFLGLDRMVRSNMTDEAHPQRGALIGRSVSSNTGLSESARLIRNAYRMMRTIKDSQSERLRTELLFNGFEFTSISPSEITDTLNVRDYFDPKKLKKQRDDLARAMSSIGIDEEKSNDAINGFFNKADELATKIYRERREPNMSAELMFESIINRFALRRFENLVAKIQSNTRHLGITKKITTFINNLNLFFADSRKEISIDPVGLIRVVTHNKVEISVENLSSGEQQLLIMFSHLHFNEFGDKSSVFVFDEPEVSLHLRWQELLLPTMLRGTPKAQIIIATHSPEIVGELTENCTDIDYD
ncbi:energy-coupling factor transporter ATP-binding protein EcfA2 [Xanthomonas arboricola]|uniref:AAA family ATPase n=1 Tax=Xanthomonas euroxanthea TaxID=2259622 RepID=UPI00141BD5E2|nr:AAA family ATPase [Xanthomonas euroxanthea]NIK40838.1 energy-coupling factor transporter ATP-binding protein EcfA2 [Xanthomonas euroxanthea]